MSGFSRPNDNIQALFPSSGSGADALPNPNELSEVVQLVKEYPSRISELANATLFQLLSTSAVSPLINDANTPQGFVDEIWTASILHNFAGQSRVTVALIDPAGNGIVIGSVQWDTAAAASIPLFGTANSFPAMSILPPRPILVAPGWHLQVSGATQAAAYVVSLSGCRIRRPLAGSLMFGS